MVARELWELRPADSTEWTRLHFAAGMNGRGLPETATELVAIPGVDGARRLEARYGPRVLSGSLKILEYTDVAFRRQQRALMTAADQKRGLAELRLTAVDGVQRSVFGYVSRGLSSNESGPRVRTVGYLRDPVEFTCPDPYWHDTATVFASWSAIDVVPGLWLWFGPLPLAAAVNAASDTVTIEGDDAAWPVWTITGPGKNPVALNQTTGARWDLTYTLGSSETVTVTTARGAKAVTSSTGADLYSKLLISSELWPLEKGANAIQVGMDNTSSLSAFSMSYQERWLAA